MPISRSLALPVLLLAAVPTPLLAQSSSSAASGTHLSASTPVEDVLQHRRWNWGAFADGGFSARNTPSYRILSVGARAGKILTDPWGPGILRGQFEYSAEFMPWWQGYTSPFVRHTVLPTSNPNVAYVTAGYPTGGAYNGLSITPIILRWDLQGTRRVLPFVQGAGGLIWTNHKFPPVGPYPGIGHQGTSVWNFTPQFGVGVQYFLKPGRSITFNANAVHISNASIGDANPGVNATVQFQIGYTWWK